MFRGSSGVNPLALTLIRWHKRNAAVFHNKPVLGLSLGTLVDVDVAQVLPVACLPVSDFNCLDILVVVALTLGASVHAEGAICQLDLGCAVLEVPLLLGRIVEGFPVDGERDMSEITALQAIERRDVHNGGAAAGASLWHDNKLGVHIRGDIHGAVALGSLGEASRSKGEQENRFAEHFESMTWGPRRCQE